MDSQRSDSLVLIKMKLSAWQSQEVHSLELV